MCTRVTNDTILVTLCLASLVCLVLITSNNLISQVRGSDDLSTSSSNSTSYYNPKFLLRLEAPHDWDIVE